MNSRSHKGKCMYDFRLLPSAYVIIDIETTGLSEYSQIIQIAALKIIDGVVADTFDTLVNSVDHIPPFISELTGITHEMLLTAPTPSYALQSFLDFVGNLCVVAHNVHFDINKLYDSCELHLGRSFHNDYFDTWYLARHTVINIENYKLCTLCDHFSIDQSHAHNALDDCISLFQCLLKMLELPIQKPTMQARTNNTPNTPTHRSAIEVLKQTINKYRNGDYSENNIYYILSHWLEKFHGVSNNSYFCKIYEKIAKYTEDEKITKDECAELLQMIETLCHPDNNIYNCCACDISSYSGSKVCFTGEFSSISRKRAENIAIGLGATIVNSVSTKTNYVVVGSHGSTAWSDGNMGTKLKKALELNTAGANIKIISEEIFLQTVEVLNA